MIKMHKRTHSGLLVAAFIMAACGPVPDAGPSRKPVLGTQGNLSNDQSPPSMATVIAADGQTPRTGDPATAKQYERGKALYQRQCGACHSLDYNRVGPRHRGVFGRAAGSISDYSYSPALQDLDLVWDAANLDAWLANPSSIAPGTAMGFRLQTPEQRAAIIAYLASLSED